MNDILNCYFQNVQGFITLNSIGKDYPDLNITKLLEFQSYVFQNFPDVILLNETWLKTTVHKACLSTIGHLYNLVTKNVTKYPVLATLKILQNCKQKSPIFEKKI